MYTENITYHIFHQENILICIRIWTKSGDLYVFTQWKIRKTHKNTIFHTHIQCIRKTPILLYFTYMEKQGFSEIPTFSQKHQKPGFRVFPHEGENAKIGYFGKMGIFGKWGILGDLPKMGNSWKMGYMGKRAKWAFWEKGEKRENGRIPKMAYFGVYPEKGKMGYFGVTP